MKLAVGAVVFFKDRVRSVDLDLFLDLFLGLLAQASTVIFLA